ncbi:MAG: sigma-70 family RNA polymerase sigma factor, partial [Phycisphaerales bacterium]
KSFWAWVYRTAVGKLQHHNRIQGNKRIEQKTSRDIMALYETVSADLGPLHHLMKKESIAIVLAAMCSLKAEYRGVLSLRCIDGMSYAQIASIMGGTPLRVRMLFRHAKGSLKRQLVHQGMGRSYFLPALIVFAALTASPGGKVSAATAIGIDTLRLAIKKNVLMATFRSVAAVVVGLVVGVTVMIGISTNNNKQVSIPELQYDDSMVAIFDNPNIGYTRRGQIIGSYNPDGGDWQYFPWPDRPRPAVSIQSAGDKPDGTFLVLPKGHYVDHQLSGPNPLADGPDVDISIQFLSWGELPEVYLVDEEGKRQHRLYPVKYRGNYPHGFMAMGFDLTQANPPFESRTLRIVGVDNAGPFGGCGLGSIAAYSVDFLAQ